MSPSRRYLAVGLARGAELWDVAAKRRVLEVSHPHPFSIVGFTTGETALITMSRNMDWHSIPDGKLVCSIPLKAVNGVWALHPSGSVVLDSPEDLDPMQQRLATAIREGDPRVTAPGDTMDITADVPRCLLFDAEGRRLFCATDKGAWVYDGRSSARRVAMLNRNIDSGRQRRRQGRSISCPSSTWGAGFSTWNTIRNPTACSWHWAMVRCARWILPPAPRPPC